MTVCGGGRNLLVMEPEPEDICPDCGQPHPRGPLYYITVAEDATWRIPAGEEGGKEIADFDRLGIVLDLEACLALFDVLRVVVTQAAAEGRL